MLMSKRGERSDGRSIVRISAAACLALFRNSGSSFHSFNCDLPLLANQFNAAYDGLKLGPNPKRRAAIDAPSAIFAFLGFKTVPWPRNPNRRFLIAKWFAPTGQRLDRNPGTNHCIEAILSRLQLKAGG